MKTRTTLRLLSALIPTALCTASVLLNRAWLAVLSVVMIYVIIATNRVMRKRASLWTFMFVGLALIPANIYTANLIVGSILEMQSTLQAITWKIVLISLLFSVEQLIFGIITRILFPHQDDSLARQNANKQ